MNTRQLFMTLLLLSFISGSTAGAQQQKIPRIGVVSATGEANAPGRGIEAFRQGLQDLGYIDGENVQVEYWYIGGKVDQAPALVAELVQLTPDVLIVMSLPSIRAAMQATTTIPIVMVTTLDPVAAGIIDSLARPGGNVTGLATLMRDLSGKRLELLKETVPRTSRVGILWDAAAPAPAIAFKEYA